MTEPWQRCTKALADDADHRFPFPARGLARVGPNAKGGPRRAPSARYRGRPGAQGGLTLVELIVVIAVTGVLAAMVASFIRQPMQAYITAGRRVALSDIADGALLRIAREVRQALPNSLRVVTVNGVQYLEFLPVVAVGRYRAALTAAGGGDILDFTDGNDNAFDVLGPPVAVRPGQYLVLYNLGLDADTDAYIGGNRRTVTSNGTVSRLEFAATGARLPLEPPAKRFFIVDAPVSFVCDPTARTLRRHWGYPISAAQPTSPTGGQSALLAARVRSCTFAYAPGAYQRQGQLSLHLELENPEDGERVALYREVVVDNEP